MRVARVEGFEAPFVLADADRAAYRRRFVTLFVLEGEGHSGGTGRVEHARNAQGEHVALKLLATRSVMVRNLTRSMRAAFALPGRRLSASMNATRSFRA